MKRSPIAVEPLLLVMKPVRLTRSVSASAADNVREGRKRPSLSTKTRDPFGRSAPNHRKEIAKFCLRFARSALPTKLKPNTIIAKVAASGTAGKFRRRSRS